MAIAKNCLPGNAIINEYFVRSSRKKSFWKSESEYKILFEQNAISQEAFKQLEDKFISIENGLRTADMLPIINADALDFFRKQKSNSLKNSKIFLHCCNRVTNFIYDNPFENPMRT